MRARIGVEAVEKPLSSRCACPRDQELTFNNMREEIAALKIVFLQPRYVHVREGTKG